MNRNDAWQLLCKYTKDKSLQKHALAVEAAMNAFAKKFNEDEDKWSIVGLVHDLDYEQFPDQHPFKGVEILKQNQYSQEIQQAVLSHVETKTGVSPTTLMEKTLCAVDELSGFIIAVALVRPSKKLADVKVKSVKKKLKDKAFARAVNRDEIYKGIDLLGNNLDEHIEFMLNALKPVASELGI